MSLTVTLEGRFTYTTTVDLPHTELAEDAGGLDYAAAVAHNQVNELMAEHPTLALIVEDEDITEE